MHVAKFHHPNVLKFIDLIKKWERIRLSDAVVSLWFEGEVIAEWPIRDLCSEVDMVWLCCGRSHKIAFNANSNSREVGYNNFKK